MFSRHGLQISPSLCVPFSISVVCVREEREKEKKNQGMYVASISPKALGIQEKLYSQVQTKYHSSHLCPLQSLSPCVIFTASLSYFLPISTVSPSLFLEAPDLKPHCCSEFQCHPPVAVKAISMPMDSDRDLKSIRLSVYLFIYKLTHSGTHCLSSLSFFLSPCVLQEGRAL